MPPILDRPHSYSFAHTLIDLCLQVEPLAALDHGEIEYDEFGKNFYEAVPAIVNMTEGDVRSISSPHAFSDV